MKEIHDKIITFSTKEGQLYFDELNNMPLGKLCEVWDKTMKQIREKYSEENDGKCKSNTNR